MRRFRQLLNVKVLLAVVVLLVGVAIYMATLPKSDAIIIGGPSICTYYSSATYKKAVGGRGTGCCGEVISWGVTSPYVKCERLYCTDVICPN